MLVAFFGFLLCLATVRSTISPESDSKRSKYDEMVDIPGGTYRMGTDDEEGSRDGESPSKIVRVAPFLIDKYPTTNAQFRNFVRSRKYKTEAEDFGWSFVLEPFIAEDIKKDIKESVPVRRLNS